MTGSVLNDAPYPTIGDFIQAVLTGKSLCPLGVHALLLGFRGDANGNRLIAEIESAVAALSIENRDRLFHHEKVAELLSRVAWEGGYQGHATFPLETTLSKEDGKNVVEYAKQVVDEFTVTGSPAFVGTTVGVDYKEPKDGPVPTPLRDEQATRWALFELG